MKLWGGRFEKATDSMVDDFHSSITFDKRLHTGLFSKELFNAKLNGISPIAPGRVILEVNRQIGIVNGGPFVHVSDVAAFVEVVASILLMAVCKCSSTRFAPSAVSFRLGTEPGIMAKGLSTVSPV